MRTKRSTESKKTTARRARARVASRTTSAASRPAITAANWIAGIDRVSLGIAGAAILAAGVLVAAYRPVQASDGVVSSAAVTEAPSHNEPADSARVPVTPAKANDENAAAINSTWPAPMTITGCLDRDGDAYRLTEAAGIGVPKSRSWKTGFLKKNTAAVTLVDAERHIRLQDHLGQRVTVTGTMVNREMQIGSMRFLSESCSEKKKV